MSGFSYFTAWLQTAWTDLLSWFGVEEQKIASFLYPIFQDAKKLVTDTLWNDIIAGIPVVAAAMVNGPEAALAAAESYIVPLIEKQGLTVAKETISTIANGLVAQAQAAQPAPAPSPAPSPVA